MRYFGRIALFAFAAFSLSACVPNNGYRPAASIAPPPMTLSEINLHPTFGQKPAPNGAPAVTDPIVPDANGIYPQLTPEQVQQRAIEQQQRLQANMDTCLMVKEGGIYKTHEAAAACLNQAVERTAAATGYPWPDLVSTLDTTRSQLAADVDAKKITKTEFDAKIAATLTELTTQEINRKTQVMNATAQQQQAWAAQRSAQAQALSAMAQQRSANAQQQIANRPVYVQPAAVAPVNNNIHCTTSPGGAPGYTNTNCY